MPEPGLAGAYDGLDAVSDLRLGEDVGDVVTHRLLADDELLGYLAVAQTLRDEAQYLQFPRGEFFKEW